MSEESVRAGLAEAEAALSAFARGPAQTAADAMAEGFERASGRIARSLASAAAAGEFSFKSLAKVALEELARIAMARLGQSERAGSVAAPVSVAFHMGAQADAESFRRNEAQIAAAIARAVAFGRRNL